MHEIESSFLSTYPTSPAFYKRYLDDIFLIWTGTEEQLIKFIDAFNNVHKNISFTHTYSRTEINFLDVNVRVEGGKLITSVYRKPTDAQQYLHFKSCHPRHCKTSIPYSQAHRFRRICSETKDFKENTDRLRNVLIKQHYPPPIIDDAIQKAANLNRHQILHNQNKESKGERSNLILTFTSNAPNVNKILKKHFNIIEQSDRLKKLFTVPPRVVYRRPKNVRDYVVHSKTKRTGQVGCHPCGKSRCQVCKHMQTTTIAESTHGNFTHTIHGDLNCDSPNVVYLLECGICAKQYVGQTDTPFRIRFNNHRSHVNTLPNLPLSKHIKSEGHSFDSIKVTLLQGTFRSQREREQREAYLIHKFNTVEHGINEHPGALPVLRALKRK